MRFLSRFQELFLQYLYFVKCSNSNADTAKKKDSSYIRLSPRTTIDLGAMNKDTQTMDTDAETAKARKKKKASPKAADMLTEATAEATTEATAEAPAQVSAEAATPSIPNFGDLDQVRQILFGAESRELHDRLIELEKHFEDKIAALTDAVERHFNAMESSLSEASDTLDRRLDDEQAQRADAEAGLGKDIEAVAQALQDNRAQLDENLAETERALRASLSEEAGKASKDRTTRFDKLSARLEQATADLGDAKTDRRGLADLFDELSARLRNNDSN